MKYIEDVDLTRPEKAIIVAAFCLVPFSSMKPTMGNIDAFTVRWGIEALGIAMPLLILIGKKEVLESTLRKLKTTNLDNLSVNLMRGNEDDEGID